MIQSELATLILAFSLVGLWIVAIFQSIVIKKQSEKIRLMVRWFDMLSYVSHRAVEELTSKNGIVNQAKKEILFNSLMYESLFGRKKSHNKDDEL